MIQIFVQNHLHTVEICKNKSKIREKNEYTVILREMGLGVMPRHLSSLREMGLDVMPRHLSS